MVNLIIICFLSLSFIAVSVCFIKLKRKHLQQKKDYEQVLLNVKEIMDNVSVVEYIALENFIKSQCDNDDCEIVPYQLSESYNALVNKKKQIWKNIYEYLFNDV